MVITVVTYVFRRDVGNANLKAVNNRSPSLELPCGQRLLFYLGKHLSKRN